MAGGDPSPARRRLLRPAEVRALWRECRRVCRLALGVDRRPRRPLPPDPNARIPDRWLFRHRWSPGGRDPRTGTPLRTATIGGRTTCWSPARQRLPRCTAKLRLDELLVARGLAASRAQAKALVMAGRVRRGTERLDKPGREFPADAELAVLQPPRFVSRGGEKLAAALEHFALDLRGAHVLDVGASTGGFTDCALQAGAASVVCVDVGRAQLHARLRADPRVTNLEKINARNLRPADLPRRPNSTRW